MTGFMRGAVLASVAMASFVAAAAADRTSLETEREKISYMIGMDVGRSLAMAGPDIDLAEFGRSVRNALDGGKPLLDEAAMMQVGPALMQRVAARNGQQVPGMAPGSQPPAVDKGQVGLMLGADVGRSLAPLAAEIELPVFLQAVRTVIDNGKPLLGEAEAATVGEALMQRMQAKTTAQGDENRKAGEAFMAANKSKKGVFTTASGLQYMVLRQGSGARPVPSSRVRVQYHGTLLDGTVFDSSYDRGQAAEFGLGQVIAGWTEGLTLMPVGAKYRFWIPGDLAYGASGSPPNIGANATLVFDVELLDVL